jgi:hypothetical protein
MLEVGDAVAVSVCAAVAMCVAAGLAVAVGPGDIATGVEIVVAVGVPPAIVVLVGVGFTVCEAGNSSTACAVITAEPERDAVAG